MKYVQMVLILIISNLLQAGDGGKVKVMDPDFYEEILFPGHEALNAVWDLHASGPYVYIALCAEDPYTASVNLYRYDTRTGEKKMILDPDKAAGVNLETGVLPQSKFHTGIRTMKDGRLFMVSHNTASGIYQPYWRLDNLWLDPTGFNSRAFIYDPSTDDVIYKGIPFSNEDIYYGQLDPELNLYYGSGMRTQSLCVIDLNDMSVTEIADHPCGIAIVVDDDHMVYTTDRKQRIWKWDPFKEQSTMTGLRMPHSPMLPESKGTCTFSWRDEDGWIYAVVSYNNRICRYKPKEGIMEDLGNPTPWKEDNDRFYPVGLFTSAPVRAGNGKIYYAVLNENVPYYDGAEIIEFDPETGVKRNLGTMKLSDGTNACVLGEGDLGADGRIYWGDGNHGKRGGMMWAFDPSKVPDDYEPVEEVDRVPRFGALPEMRYVKTGNKNKIWRLRPQVRAFPQFKPLWEKTFNEGRLDTVSLIKSGYPLWDNGIYAMSEPYEGYIYGIAGGENYYLFRVSENTLELEQLGRIPATEKIFNGNGIVACKEGVFVVGDDLCRWSEESGLSIFKDFPDGEYPAALARDRENPYLYVLKDPSNQLAVIDLKTRNEIRSYGLYGPVQSRWLAPLQGGGVMGFEGNAVVCKIDSGLRIEKMEQHFPSLKGLEFISEVTSVTTDAAGIVWGGTREGYLFSADPGKKTVTNHGKPGPYYLKGIVTKDGVVYSMSGGDFGETHLFTYKRDTGFEDKGIITKKLVNCAVRGNDDKIYIGEYSSSSSIIRFSDHSGENIQ